MTLSRKVKSVITKPYKKTENFFIPLFNKINNYLDIWFPQDKWNWRKIAVIWASIQAMLITILELYIEYKNYEQVKAIYGYFNSQGENERSTIRLLSFTDSLTVYHMIFIIALFFQLYFVCDTVSKSSIIQLIPQFIVNLGFTIYSIIQYRQAEETKTKDYIAKIITNTTIVINEPKNVEFTIIGLMSLFSIGWAVIDLRLYKVFGWNVFKQLGADIGVKNRLKLYQFFLAFLKIDIFFFTAFAIQFFFFTISYLQSGELLNKYKTLNIVLLVICILMPFIGIMGITKENYKIMCIFIIFLSISFGYMVYSLTDIINEKIIENSGGNNCETGKCHENKYKNCTNSLSFACVSSIIMSILSFILGLVNFKNFPKGLKKDKSLHTVTNSNHSTLSSTYSNPKRWSIE